MSRWSVEYTRHTRAMSPILTHCPRNEPHIAHCVYAHTRYTASAYHPYTVCSTAGPHNRPAAQMPTRVGLNESQRISPCRNSGDTAQTNTTPVRVLVHARWHMNVRTSCVLKAIVDSLSDKSCMLYKTIVLRWMAAASCVPANWGSTWRFPGARVHDKLVWDSVTARTHTPITRMVGDTHL